ncbi:helix-turn-helix domain-containing protein [Streptomyces luteocolor]|uniref:helix-turn-helix domain-containing protein n=1 Tax=Streptomyces luteocolor TaxID=285500 RepID=UPI000853D1B7|nr:helix-turn-helix transcriptional regulator [Streptomyces luteocolor]
MRRALTARQRQVLGLVANGNTNRQIARWLGCDPRTVCRHLAGIYRTLGAQDRAQAVALGLRYGDITQDDIHEPAREAA